MMCGIADGGNYQLVFNLDDQGSDPEIVVIDMEEIYAEGGRCCFKETDK